MIFLIGKQYHYFYNKFHYNIGIKNDILSKFTSFYQDIFIKWISKSTAKPAPPYIVLSEFLWFNSNIKDDSKAVHFSFFLDQNLNCSGQLFNDNGKSKTWKDLEI